jgi:hypothetical protein
VACSGGYSAVDRCQQSALRGRREAAAPLPKSHAGLENAGPRRDAETNAPRGDLSLEGCVSVR